MKVDLKRITEKAARVPGAAAQRFRLGLTGLAAIFVAVMVTAAGMRPAHSGSTIKPPAETLSILGVAPGARPDAVPAPKPVPRRR